MLISFTMLYLFNNNINKATSKRPERKNNEMTHHHHSHVPIHHQQLKSNIIDEFS